MRFTMLVPLGSLSWTAFLYVQRPCFSAANRILLPIAYPARFAVRGYSIFEDGGSAKTNRAVFRAS